MTLTILFIKLPLKQHQKCTIVDKKGEFCSDALLCNHQTHIICEIQIKIENLMINDDAFSNQQQKYLIDRVISIIYIKNQYFQHFQQNHQDLIHTIQLKLLIMYENPFSKRTKQQNQLKSKTQSFLKNYQQSLHRVKKGTSMNNLAGLVYSEKQSIQMSPKKKMLKSQSISQISYFNPEQLSNSTLKGLNMRASHITNYSEINTDLILQKKRLEQLSAHLKNEILKQTKVFNAFNTNCKKAQNGIEKASNSLNQLTKRSNLLCDGIVEAKQSCKIYSNQLNRLINNNSQLNMKKNQEQVLCNQIEAICKNTKDLLFQEEKVRGFTKNQLIKGQIVMNSASILMKQRQNQKASLLLSINRSFNENK